VGAVLFLVLVVGGCALLVSRAVHQLTENAHPAEDVQAASEAAFKDVVVNRCEPTAKGREVKGTVSNQAGRRSDFVIQVDFEGPTGQQLDQGTAIVQGLNPSRSAEWSVVSRAERAAASGAVCRVAKVMRTSSP
jgi:hypothetical protein